MREADIRPADIMAEYLRLSAADARQYFPNSAGLVPRSCPACGSADKIAAFAKNGFHLVRCAGCDTLFVDPCPTGEQLAPFYADSPSARYWAEVFFPSVAEARRTRIFRPRVERVLALMAEGQCPVENVVEVGAGAAIFLEEFRTARAASSLRAIEPGRALAAQCRDKGFETYEGFLEQAVVDPAWTGRADLVACFEVVEHTPETAAFVAALAALARPGGTVLFSGLCGDGFDIRVLGARSNAVSPPHHLTFLSVRGTERLMARAGLTDIHVLTPGELDVDIVVNAVKADDQAVTDPFLRALLLGPDDAARSRFQGFLRDNRLSSHLWAVGRKADRASRGGGR